MFRMFTPSLDAEVDRLLCPQMSNTTQSENQHRNSMNSATQLLSFPETETYIVVSQVALGRRELLVRLTRTRHVTLPNMELKLFPDFKMPLVLPWLLILS